MNILDIIFAVIVGYFFLRGLARGLLIEVAGLGGAILGFFLANEYHSALAPYVGRAISSPGWALTVSYLAIFVGTLVLFTMLAKAIKKVLTLTFTSWLDHLGGAGFGLAKALLVCSVILAVLVQFFGDANFIRESRSAPHIEMASAQLRGFLPTSSSGDLFDTSSMQRSLADQIGSLNGNEDELDKALSRKLDNAGTELPEPQPAQ